MKNQSLINLIYRLLKIARVMAIILLGVVAIVTIVVIFSPPAEREQYFLPTCYFKANSMGALQGKIQNDQLPITSMMVEFYNLPKTGIMPWIILNKLLIILLSIYILNKFIQVTSTVMEKQLFVRENAIRLRHAAFAVFIGIGMKLIFAIGLTIFLRNKIQLDGFQLRYVLDNWSKTSIWLPIMMLVFAEVFRIGTELKEESELTI